MHIHTRVCTCMCICLNPELFVPFTGYPSCGFQNCFSSASAFLRFACLRFLLFNLCFTISPVCLLPLISPFLLGFLSSLPPLFLVRSTPPALLCPFSLLSFLLSVFPSLLSYLESLPRALYPPPYHPLSLLAHLSWHLKTSPASTCLFSHGSDPLLSPLLILV